MTAPSAATAQRRLAGKGDPVTGISRKYIAALVAALLALTGVVVLRLTVFGEEEKEGARPPVRDGSRQVGRPT